MNIQHNMEYQQPSLACPRESQREINSSLSLFEKCDSSQAVRSSPNYQHVSKTEPQESTKINPMNSTKCTRPELLAQTQPTKNPFPRQVEQIHSIVSRPPHHTFKDEAVKLDRTNNATPNERLFLRKISKMISNEQWRELDTFLRSSTEISAFRAGLQLASSHPKDKGEPGNDVSVIDSSLSNLSFTANDCGNDLSPMEVVHFACRFNPPRTIIRHLASLYPEGVSCPDNMGRLPLHYAVKWGSSYKLICYLVEKDRSAASVKDSLGKTPLHLLCEKYAESYDPRNASDFSAEDSMLGAVKVLLDAAPDSVNIEDNEDVTALEYAIESDSPYKAVRFLQKASERDWKERKKTSMPGENSHVKIEEKLHRDQQHKQQMHEMNRERKRSSEQGLGPYDIARLHSSLGSLNVMNSSNNRAGDGTGSNERAQMPVLSGRRTTTRSKFAMSA